MIFKILNWMKNCFMLILSIDKTNWFYSNQEEDISSKEMTEALLEVNNLLGDESEFAALEEKHIRKEIENNKLTIERFGDDSSEIQRGVPLVESRNMLYRNGHVVTSGGTTLFSGSTGPVELYYQFGSTSAPTTSVFMENLCRYKKIKEVEYEW